MWWLQNVTHTHTITMAAHQIFKIHMCNLFDLIEFWPYIEESLFPWLKRYMGGKKLNAIMNKRFGLLC